MTRRGRLVKMQELSRKCWLAGFFILILVSSSSALAMGFWSSQDIIVLESDREEEDLVQHPSMVVTLTSPNASELQTIKDFAREHGISVNSELPKGERDRVLYVTGNLESIQEMQN